MSPTAVSQPGTHCYHWNATLTLNGREQTCFFSFLHHVFRALSIFFSPRAFLLTPRDIMAKQRKPAQPSRSAAGARRRSRSADSHDNDNAPSASKRNARAMSPAKDERHVGWRRRLEQGPTPGRADHRHQSPMRSAMADNRSTGEVDDEDEDEMQHFRDFDQDDDDKIELMLHDEDEQVFSDHMGKSRQPAIRSSPAKTYYEGCDGPALGLPCDGSEEAHPRLAGSDRTNLDRLPSCSQAPRSSSAAPADRVQEPFKWELLPALDLRHIVDAKDQDLEVCKRMDQLRQAVAHYSEAFPTTSKMRNYYNALINSKPGQDQIVRYIGCLSLGGRGGDKPWKELLDDEGCRRALVFGILGRVLKEHVFDDLWFGGTDAQRQALHQSQVDMAESDGKSRT